MRNVRDMVVVITGASSGLGRALAVELSARGAKLVLGARRLERLQKLNEELGGKHVCLATDVSNPEDCRELIRTAADTFGRLDTVVCNAGYGFAKPFDAMSEQDIRRVFETNFFGTTECARLGVGIMKKQELRDGWRGQIMIVSSACARRGLPYLSTYAATKAAQLSLAEGLRVELRPLGIAVTSVHPVLAQTDFFDTIRKLSGINPSALAQGARQTAQTVAHRMANSIAKPRRELWPKPLYRTGLNLAVMLPGLVDIVLGRMRNRLLRDNNLDAQPPRHTDSEVRLTNQ